MVRTQRKIGRYIPIAGTALLAFGTISGVTPALAQTTGVSPRPTLGAPAPQRPLTLEDVLAIALRNNSNVTLAQERLLKAQELIVQAEAQGRPQVSAALTDTLSSEKTFGTAGGSTFTPSLPGGGTIPVVVDTGGGTAGSFVGGGGGGTTSSTGQSGNGIGGGTSTTGTSSAGVGTTSTGVGSGSSTTVGGTGTGTSGTGTTSTGTGATSGGTGASSTGTSSTGAATGFAMMAAVPAIVQELASATGSGTSTSGSAAAGQITAAGAHDTSGTTTTGGTGTGNPTTTGGTTFTSGSGGQYNNYGGRLTVTQYLDIFNLVGTAKAVERITRDFYALDLERVSNETALTVKNTFFNVLLAQSQVAVQQEQVRYATENVRIAQARFTAGAAPEFDVVSAQTTLSNAQQQLISAQNQLALTSANLNNIIGVSQDTPLTLQTPATPATVNPDLPQSLQTAYITRPELRQADNNIQIAKKLITLAGATLKPSLALVGSGAYTGTTSGGGRKDTYSISAELGIPLSDGGSTKSRERSAQIDLDTQVITRDQLRQNVELEVRQAIIAVNNAQAQAASATQGVTQAQEAVRLAQVRYQNGLGTFLEVTNAQAQLATARTNLATAQFNTQTALAQLTRAEGGR